MAIIGIMDSGVGGLSVYREIRKILPGEHFIYFSDNAHCPYGEKSREYIIDRLRHITDYFIGRGAQAIVLACNTATSAAIATLREEYEIPFVGMEPAIKPAISDTTSGTVGVLATHGTLQGDKYQTTRDKYAEGVRVLEHVGEGFVELVESGRLSGPEAEDTVKKSLKPLLDAGADRIVLGCTHYPFLLDTLRKVAAGLGHPDVVFIDPAPAVARQLAAVLKEKGIGTDPLARPETEFISSGDPAALKRTLKLI